MKLLVTYFTFVLLLFASLTSAVSLTLSQNVKSNNISAGNYFGSCVSLYNTTAVIGAPSVTSAYIFNDGVQQQQLQFTNDTSSTFGSSCSIYGNWAIVGSYSYSKSGAVLFYSQNSSIWSLSQIVRPTEITQYQRFGFSISIEEDVAIIGAPAMSVSLVSEAAYIYRKTGDTWNLEEKLTQNTNYYKFGVAVDYDSISGLAVVGAPKYGATGAVFIYQHSNSNWSLVTTVYPNITGSGGSGFGYSVCISNTTLMVGALLFDNSKGGVFVFTSQLNFTVWNQTQFIFISDLTDTSYFGNSISISNEYSIIGAYLTNSGFGKAYIYSVSDDSNWYLLMELSYKSNVTSSDEFGSSVSIYGTRILVGAPETHDLYKGSNAGGAIYYNILCPTNDKYGSNCDRDCSCVNGLCYSGIYGNGTCVSCHSSYYGTDCTLECACPSTGVCNNNPTTGNGNCSSCHPGYWGNNCSEPCTCKNGVCNNDPINGNGECLSCNSNYYGNNCHNLCNCSNGTCDNNPSTGTGYCSACENNFYNNSCSEMCDPACATCDDGPLGTGSCTSCPQFYAGSKCNIQCPSNCLSCSDGIDGTGTCTSCTFNRFGPSCSPCECTWGTCDISNGLCSSCYGGYYGAKCEFVCLCDITQVCNDGINGDGICWSEIPMPQTTPIVSNSSSSTSSQTTTIGTTGKSGTSNGEKFSFSFLFMLLSIFGCYYFFM